MTKLLTYALTGLLTAVALSTLLPTASAGISQCAFPDSNQCVCVGLYDCSDTPSDGDECPFSYSYDQDYWWGYGCRTDNDVLEVFSGKDLPDRVEDTV